MASIDQLRIIDANANRAMEGLRVAEDFARFVLDDAYLTRVGKDLRHDLSAALADVSFAQRTASRETQADVGVEISNASEQNRATLNEVVIANLQRAKEAVRTIEEVAKVERNAAAFEQLRYRLYSWEKSIAAAMVGATELHGRLLYVLVDALPSEAAFVERITQLAQGGADVIQLRDKQASDRVLLSRGHLLRGVAEQNNALFIMNDRPDLAVLARAHGVHVGQEELSVKDARRIVGPDMLIGVSTHSLEQAQRAVEDGANYIGVGPTFPSQTKTFAEFTGVELLKEVAAEIGLPAFAIGGVNEENIARVLAAGFTRAAVSHAVVEDTLNRTQRLKAMLAKPPG